MIMSPERSVLQQRSLYDRRPSNNREIAGGHRFSDDPAFTLP